MFKCVRNRANGFSEYLWTAIYSLVFILSSSWFVASMVNLGEDTQAQLREQTTLTAGPYLFVSLALFLVVRPALAALKIRFLGFKRQQ